MFSVLGAEPLPTGFTPVSPGRGRPEPVLSAEAYLVALVHHPKPLLARRPRKRLAPASLTKLMTAAVAAEKLAPEDVITLSARAAAAGERVSGAEVGEVFSRQDLLRLTLISSANDAALALAEAVGVKSAASGSDHGAMDFVRLMNEKARVLGMSDTNFANPTGLDAAGHYASAADLGRLAEYILDRHPDLWEVTRYKEAAVSGFGGRRHTLRNTNELLKEFPAIRGGKTGLTDNAKGALLLLYPVRTGQTAIIVLLKSEDRFGDGRKIIKWFEENF